MNFEQITFPRFLDVVPRETDVQPAEILSRLTTRSRASFIRPCIRVHRTRSTLGIPLNSLALRTEMRAVHSVQLTAAGIVRFVGSSIQLSAKGGLHRCELARVNTESRH